VRNKGEEVYQVRGLNMLKNRYIQYVIWLLFFLAWIYIRNDILIHFEEKSRQTFEILPYALYRDLMYIIDGFFLGILMVIGRTFSINKPLLLVIFLPILLVSLYTIAVSYLIPSLQRLPLQLFLLFKSPIIYNLIGISLLVGLFSGTRK
jgi:hypothetical protein